MHRRARKRARSVDLSAKNDDTRHVSPLLDDWLRSLPSADLPRFVTCDGDDVGRLIANGWAADAAVIRVTAREGLTTGTRRCLQLAAVFDIGCTVVAVDGLTDVDRPAAVFGELEAACRAFATRAGLALTACTPVSVAVSRSVTEPGIIAPWYQGPSLLECLERAARTDLTTAPFRLSAASVDVAPRDRPVVSGVVVSGIVRTDDAVRALPGGRLTRVARLTVGGRDVAVARAGDTAAVTLSDAIDLAAGCVLAATDAPPSVAGQFEAVVVWTHERPMLQGRSYEMQLGTQHVNATIAPLKHRVHPDTLEHLAAKTLDQYDVGVCQFELSAPIVFEPYREHHDLGRCILRDPQTQAVVGTGMLQFALRRSQNVHWQALDVNKEARGRLKAQRPCVIWLTGLSGGGKSTIANLLEKRLHALGRHTYVLDGDNVRHGLNKDLGFTETDRVENIRRVAEVARLMVDAGLIVLVAFISPFRAERQMARQLVEQDEFIEVFVDTPLAVAEARDPKGLYKKARRGDLKNFTGIDSPYEAPEHPELRIDTTRLLPEQAVDAILAELEQRGSISL